MGIDKIARILLLNTARFGQCSGGSVKNRVPCVESGQAIKNRAKYPVPRASAPDLSLNSRKAVSWICKAVVNRAPLTVNDSDVLRHLLNACRHPIVRYTRQGCA